MKKENLEIREETKDLKGTLGWWNNLPKRVYIQSRGTYPNTPNLCVDFGDGVANFLAEIGYKKDDSCRPFKGCNVTYVMTDEEGYDTALFDFQLTKKCHEAIDKFIDAEIDKFLAWWEEA